MFADRILRRPTPGNVGAVGYGHRYAYLLWGLTLLFALRVLGQAVQRWLPQEFLPPAAAFQGSELPYGLLFAAQLLILAIMARFSRRVQTAALRASRHSGKILAWAGSVYMTAALGRLVLGLLVSDAPAWFHARIPAIWHIVLASFLLVMASFHARESARLRPGA